MTVFRTAWRDHTRADREHAEDYDTFVYEIGVTE